MLPAVMGNSCTPPCTRYLFGRMAASLAPKSTVLSITLFFPLPLPTD